MFSNCIPTHYFVQPLQLSVLFIYKIDILHSCLYPWGSIEAIHISSLKQGYRATVQSYTSPGQHNGQAEIFVPCSSVTYRMTWFKQLHLTHIALSDKLGLCCEDTASTLYLLTVVINLHFFQHLIFHCLIDVSVCLFLNQIPQEHLSGHRKWHRRIQQRWGTNRCQFQTHEPHRSPGRQQTLEASGIIQELHQL